MYTEHGSLTNRDGWKFTYKGSELLAYAKKKLEAFTAKETAARKQMASLMLDAKVNANGEEVDKVKRVIASAGMEREKCAVWVHEFQRNGDKEYWLALGDVVYFGIAGLPEEIGQGTPTEA